jgi:hypothetical protein
VLPKIWGGIVTGIGLITAWFFLFPKPTFERDVSRDEANPFFADFAIKNTSPLFAMHDVHFVCNVDLAKDTTGRNFPGNHTTFDKKTRFDVGPGNTQTVECNILSNRFDMGAPIMIVPLDFSKLHELKATYTVYYRWWWNITLKASQPLRGVRNAVGRVTWQFSS